MRGHYGLFVVSDPTHHWSTAAELRPSFLAARAGAKPLTAQLHQDLATLVPSVVADAAAAAEVPVVVPPAGGVVLPPPQPQPQPQQQLLLPPPADVFRYDAVFASSLRAPPPPPFPPGESVLVALRTGHFFGEYERVVPDCDVRCEFKSQGSAGADALWYHAPSACGGAPDRAFPAQIAVVMSMESSVNYHCLDDPTYMAGFDIEMTYRLRSAIPIPYLHREHVLDFAKPLVPFEEKRDEVIYIQSNCGATSGRDAILSALPSLGVPLHARGACLNNQPPLPRSVGKRDTMRQYKICATMENSRALDYVSEKMWDGMSAGCLPIYYGAQNIQEHLPAPEAIIDYERIGATPEKLAAEILRLTSNKAAYEATMAWRTKPLAELGEGYQRLVVRWGRGELCFLHPTSQCFPTGAGGLLHGALPVPPLQAGGHHAAAAAGGGGRRRQRHDAGGALTPFPKFFGVRRSARENAMGRVSCSASLSPPQCCRPPSRPRSRARRRLALSPTRSPCTRW